MKINVTLPDGSVRSYEPGATAMDVARSISEGLARNVLAAKVNGEVRDANRALPGDCTLALLNQDWRAQGGLYHLTPSGHTSWHGFACAIVDAARQRGQPLLLSADAIDAIPSTDYPTPARRPANSRLDTQAIQLAFGLHLPDWQTVFARHMAY